MKHIIIIGACLLSAALLLLLTIAGADTDFFGRKYRLLIQLNIGFVLFLVVLVGYLLWSLRCKLKAGVFGSRLTLRFLLILSLMTIVPGALIYSVSIQFLGKSIDSWFDVKVDKALESSLNIGRSLLNKQLDDLNKKTRAAVPTLSRQSLALLDLKQLLELTQAQEATVLDEHGKIITFSNTDENVRSPNIPDAGVLSLARTQGTYGAIESVTGKGLYLRMIERIPFDASGIKEDIYLLQLLQLVPKEVAEDAEIVQTVYRDYEELSLSRQGLKGLYEVTLTLVLLLSFFSSIAVAFLISEQLSAPLGMLAESTRAVAQGDFSRRNLVKSNDELGVLTESFNLMTRQLEEARTTAQLNQNEVESAKTHLESILANLSSGVLVLDERFCMHTANLSAEYILQVPLIDLEGLTIEECAIRKPSLLAFVNKILEGFNSEETGDWQSQMDHFEEGLSQVLLLRGTRLPVASGGGGVVVFDDITNLLQAQRAAAWGEVARRLAHEIKNPLTPIQLSAERIQQKFAEKLNLEDAEILRRSTETIINQVRTMKAMVNAFSEYARVPELKLRLLNLNELIQEVLSLYEMKSENEKSHPLIRLLLDPNLGLIRGDSARLRQVIHNLLQNAQDALIETTEPIITVRTEMVKNHVQFSLSDNGKGFPDHVRIRAFEPYVTTKIKGTGLGLPIVKKITEEHNGTIQIENIHPRETRVSIILPAATENDLTFDYKIT